MTKKGLATRAERTPVVMKTDSRETIEKAESSDSQSRPDADVVKLPVTHADGPFGSAPRKHGGSSGLRRRLVAFDLFSVAFAWGLAAILPRLGAVDTADPRGIGLVVAVCIAHLGAIVVQHLYLGRVASRRSVELSGLGRAAVVAGATAALISSLANIPFSTPRIIVGTAISMSLTSLFRGVYRSWLGTQRALGHHSRDLVLVGANKEGHSLKQLLDTHPELGYRICGVTGDEHDYAEWSWDVPYLGRADQTLDVLVGRTADGVLIAASAMDPTLLNGFTREMLQHDIHVHLSSGLQGIDHRRLRALPMAHEPLFYLEPSSASQVQLGIKRVIDIVGAGSVLILASPIIALAAVAIRLNDGGPVFFRQRRVGRNGKQFTVFKLRTMVPDAEARLSEVLETLGNGRDNVLFKLDNDPRRTKVGRFLEATSLDELPQLINVLNGSMSLVGPRPALPSEVAKFDDHLMDRFNVPPGVTGLWQVEARDNPSFSAYRRLDLFYVENWSLMLDFVLMLETLSSVGARVFTRIRNGDS